MIESRIIVDPIMDVSSAAFYFGEWAATDKKSHLMKNHRLIVCAETNDCVIFGFDESYYSGAMNPKSWLKISDDRFICSKNEFFEKTLTIREYNLRWLESIRGN